MNAIIQFPTTINPQSEAKMLFFAGWSIVDIAKKTGIPRQTIHFWKKSENWDNAPLFERCQATVEAKYLFLLTKDSKSNADYKELEFLGRQMEKLYFPKPERNKRTATINKADFDWTDFTAKITEAMSDLYLYQKTTMNQIEAVTQLSECSGEALVLKARQTGMTRTLARTRFLRAITKNHSQIFISASKNQAFQTKSYILQLVNEATGISLTGKEKITLKPGLDLMFLGCNSNTAQGYTGDVTCDEFFWMPKFDELSMVVSGCATLKQYNVIYSSTPSSKTHQAYKFWAATAFNKSKKNKQSFFKVDHRTLKNGLLCNDGKFRKIITIEDAIEGGLDLIDINKLKLRYDSDQYNQLFMAEFMDDLASAFNFDQIMNCMVDIWDDWQDYKPIELPHRPLGNSPVAIGFDPARSHDGSACVVMAVPTKQGEKYRILEKHLWHGIDFEMQAQSIKDICGRYNVVHLGIDANGLGVAVAERVQQFYPDIIKYHSNPQLKSLFVMQAQNVFAKKRIEFDRGWLDVIQSFIAIKKIMTKSGSSTTYASNRSEETSHSDLAWATMYALGFEALDGSTVLDGSQSSVIII